MNRLAFLYPGAHATADRANFDRTDGGYRSQKILVVLEQGSTATVRMGYEVKDVASLLYDPEKFASGPYEVGDGESSVRFEACKKGTAKFGPPDGPTQFNGGFIVAGARCVPVTVEFPNTDVVHEVVLSFGAGRCRR